VTLTAVPFEGYAFVEWLGDLSGKTNPSTLTVDDDDVVMARFAPVAVATLMSVFEAEPSDAGIEIRWQFTTPDDVASVALERATQVDGPWTAVDAASALQGDVTVAQDRSAAPGATSFYRLIVSLRQGGQTIEGPVSAAAANLVTDLAILAPNPALGSTRVDFAVARAGTVRLSVLDVAGREQVVLARGNYAAGRHTIQWDGRIGARKRPRGSTSCASKVPGRRG
jgi:acyl-coenzyme A thioesterase PaaI-like protein